MWELSKVAGLSQTDSASNIEQVVLKAWRQLMQQQLLKYRRQYQKKLLIFQRRNSHSFPEEIIKPETPPKVEPQVSENEKGGEVAALGVVTVHKEVKASTPAKPLASSKATDELPQTSSVTQNYLLALGFALVTLTAGIWKRRKVSKD